MRKFLFILFFITSFKSVSQVSVNRINYYHKLLKVKDETFERFHKTTTVFIFSNLYEREIYEEILSKSWNVTPYKIVNIEEFKLLDYLNGSYSFASVKGNTLTTQNMSKIGTSATYLYSDFEFFMYKDKELLKELKSPKIKSKKNYEIRNIIESNKVRLGIFILYPNGKFIDVALRSSKNKASEAMATQNTFHNYQPGFLLNYFQKINQLIKDKESRCMYYKVAKSELKNLKTQTLYIPEYIATKYSGLSLKERPHTEKQRAKLFKNYKFKYAYISDEEINEKILKQEEFYYLRYCRSNTQRFVDVVNSKTGEIIYSGADAGISYNLKPKEINKISKQIKKAR